MYEVAAWLHSMNKDELWILKHLRFGVWSSLQCKLAVLLFSGQKHPERRRADLNYIPRGHKSTIEGSQGRSSRCKPGGQKLWRHGLCWLTHWLTASCLASFLIQHRPKKLHSL